VSDIPEALYQAIYDYDRTEEADIKFLSDTLRIAFTDGQKAMLKVYRKHIWCVAAQEGWRAAQRS
jgi:hypothetical protein